MRTELRRTTLGRRWLIIYCLIITDPNKLLLYSPTDGHIIALVRGIHASCITDRICLCEKTLGLRLSLRESNTLFSLARFLPTVLSHLSRKYKQMTINFRDSVKSSCYIFKFLPFSKKKMHGRDSEAVGACSGLNNVFTFVYIPSSCRPTGSTW